MEKEVKTNLSEQNIFLVHLSIIPNMPKSESNPDIPAFPSVVSVWHWGQVIFSG